MLLGFKHDLRQETLRENEASIFCKVTLNINMQKVLTKRFILFSFYMAVHTSCFVLSYKTYIKRLRFSHSGQRSNQMFTCVRGRSHFEAYTESRKLNSYRLVTIGQSKLRSVFKQLPVKLAWDLRRLWVKLGVGNRLDRV